MRNTRSDVIAAAMRVLDAQGLENCSMRRVAAELGVQPSALYHHVPDKQSLLALMADEIVEGVGERGGRGACDASTSAASAAARGAQRGVDGGPDADVDPRSFCHELRDAMLAVRDGADVVATASAFRLGASDVEARLALLVGEDGARTLLLYTFGQTQSTQTHRQAAELGALVGGLGDRGARGGSVVDMDSGVDCAPGLWEGALDLDASFDRGLDIILAGLEVG